MEVHPVLQEVDDAIKDYISFAMGRGSHLCA